MIIPFVQALRDYSRLFQQVLLDLGTLYHALLVEVDVDVLAEPGRVVVPHCLGVAERCNAGESTEIFLAPARAETAGKMARAPRISVPLLDTSNGEQRTYNARINVMS